MGGDQGGAQRLVVGRIGDGELDVLRVQYDAPARAFRLLGAAVIPWASGESLGEPLERLVRWRPHEPVIFAIPTPSLAGGTVMVSAHQLVRTGSDARARLLQTRMKAREEMLESAARYFDCTIESLNIVDEVIRNRETEQDIAATVIVRHGEGSSVLAIPDPPPDVPNVQRTILPLFLGSVLGSSSEPWVLLLLEEEQLTYGVWSQGVPLLLRTLPVGGRILVAQLTQSIQCSPRAAEELLIQAEDGTLSSPAMRILARVLKVLLPLFTGAFEVFGRELGTHEPPKRLGVVGLWPSVFSKLYCRPPYVSRCVHATASPRILPRPDMLIERRLGSEPLTSPRRRLLELMAVAAAAERVDAPRPAAFLGARGEGTRAHLKNPFLLQ